MTNDLIVIAENIHATRIVLSPERKGKKCVVLDDGSVAIPFVDPNGRERQLRLPQAYRESQEYADGKIKHVRVAIEMGMSGEADGVDYLRSLAQAQIEAGAAFLDVNVDEVSPMVERQIEAMRWITGVLAPFSRVPLSIDSSHPEVIEAGLKGCDVSKRRPLINSASLERPEVLDLAARYDTEVIISACGASGIPSGVEDRVANIEEMVNLAKARGIGLDRIHLDPLVLPVGTDSENGNYFLETVRWARSRYGAEIHISGGLSNVSFGVPARKLLNEVFLILAMDAGCDSAIIDPTQVRAQNIQKIDRDSLGFRLASDALTGKDPFCMEYVTAFREGRLTEQ
ncbi:MAG TPA: dihydropteroate synthase [bacterium]|nr:dihydropteroate synthase [bacterium]HQL61958.1 dihydropteroate synthase [bacterium]